MKAKLFLIFVICVLFANNVNPNPIARGAAKGVQKGVQRGVQKGVQKGITQAISRTATSAMEEIGIGQTITAGKPILVCPNNISVLKLTENKFEYDGNPITEEFVKNLFKDKPKLRVQGNLTDYHANVFREKGVNFVFNETKLITQPEKYYFIFAAEDAELTNFFSPSFKIPRTSFVNNHADLIKTINLAKQDNRQPILIFDNQNGNLFNKPISSYEINEVITCKSYTIPNGNFSMFTTGYVDAPNAVKALSKIPDERLYIDDFFLQFERNYNNFQAASNQKSTFITAGVAIIGGGALIVIILNNDKKN